MDTTAVVDTELKSKERRAESLEAARAEIRRLAQGHMQQMVSEGWRMHVDVFGNKILEARRL